MKRDQRDITFHVSQECQFPETLLTYPAHKSKVNMMAITAISRVLAKVQTRSKAGFLPRRLRNKKTGGAAIT